eukprot:395132_1
MSSSEDLHNGAVIFTVLSSLLICCACGCSVFFFVASMVGEGGIHGKVPRKESKFNKLCTFHRINVLLVMVPLIISLCLMWEIYNDNIQTNNKQKAFWLAAGIPFAFSVVMLGCSLLMVQFDKIDVRYL